MFLILLIIIIKMTNEEFLLKLKDMVREMFIFVSVCVLHTYL
jgi:hypothetical protein